MNVRLALSSLILGVIAGYGVVIALISTMDVFPGTFTILALILVFGAGWYNKNRIARTLGRQYAARTQ